MGVPTAFEPFQLPNKTWLKNRTAKAAMEERMADTSVHNQPSSELEQLYRAWGQGGVGLILSGHVMIDPRAMAEPGAVLLAEEAVTSTFDESRWRRWMEAAKSGGSQFWLQLNHPGRQIMKGSGLPTYGPSATPMKMGFISSMFEVPIAMSEEQIQKVIQRFAWAAKRAEELGADGIEIHAAHGYLLSQFLSPLVNKRTDQWGGSLENRARLLFEVVKAIRKVVTPKFGVGVKINTADFQRGGFEVEDLYWVVTKLNAMGLDLVEVSGGNYESPVMSTGNTSVGEQVTSTAAREAYFLQAAKRLKDIGSVPILVTGGISHKDTFENVVGTSDHFLAGIGTAMGLVPDLPLRWSRGEDPAPKLASPWFLPKGISAAAQIAAVQYNMQQIGNGAEVWQGVWPTYAFLRAFLREHSQMSAYKSWIKTI